MKDRKLFLYWLYLYILCAALGFIPSPRNPLVVAALALLTVGFFVPPGMILYRAIQRNDRRQLRLVALLSAASLALTLALFIANTLTVLAPSNVLLGNVFNTLLVLFSAPMMCAPYQAISIFGWACLLFVVIFHRKKG